MGTKDNNWEKLTKTQQLQHKSRQDTQREINIAIPVKWHLLTLMYTREIFSDEIVQSNINFTPTKIDLDLNVYTCI